MNKPVAIAVSTVALAVVVLNGGAGMAKGGASTDTWPTGLPLPTSPGTLVSQSSTSGVVRSTESVAVVQARLDDLYVTQKGCSLRLAVNKPKDYLCFSPATRKTAKATHLCTSPILKRPVGGIWKKLYSTALRKAVTIPNPRPP